jgi:tRNA (adenine22-N1)-methyltransferase
MPKLDQRLIAVTRRIRCKVHVDIGSDHGLLLASLLGSRRIEHGIAIENKQQPWRNSRETLSGLAAEVRLGDGLEALAIGEADSLSICGMGAENMTAILEKHPDRVPAKVVLQPNSRPEIVRQWAWQAGFWLVAEQVLRTKEDDSEYDGVDLASGIAFGPLLLKEADPDFVADILEEREYWSQFSKLTVKRQRRLALINKVVIELQENPLAKASR